MRTIAALAVLLAVVPTPAPAAPCRKLCKSDIRTCRTAVPPATTCTGLAKAERKACRSDRLHRLSACRKDALALCKSTAGAQCTVPTTTTTTTPGSSTTSTTTGGGTFTLTIENYLAWCSVTVNGGTASTAPSQMLTFPASAVVTLNADKASGTFVWGYWVGTAGDTGPSHDASMATTVTMTGDKTIQACCPLASDPGTPCPPP